MKPIHPLSWFVVTCVIVSKYWLSKLVLVVIQTIFEKDPYNGWNYQTFAEGVSINQPPLTRENYPFWKLSMRIFLESVDKRVGDAIVNNPYIPKVVVDGTSWKDVIRF